VKNSHRAIKQLPGPLVTCVKFSGVFYGKLADIV